MNIQTKPGINSLLEGSNINESFPKLLTNFVTTPKSRGGALLQLSLPRKRQTYAKGDEEWLLGNGTVAITPDLCSKIAF